MSSFFSCAVIININIAPTSVSAWANVMPSLIESLPLIKSGCINTGAPFNPARMYAISPHVRQIKTNILINFAKPPMFWPFVTNRHGKVQPTVDYMLLCCVRRSWSWSGSAVLGQFPKVFLQGLRFSVGVNSTRCWTTELIRRQRKRTEAGSGWVSYFYLWTTTKSWVERGLQHTI